MKNKLLLLIAISYSTLLFSQTFDSTAQKYGESITAQELKDHLYVIASDEFEGRETGKKGQKMAMDYLIKEFKSNGIKPYRENTYSQSFPLIEQENSGISLDIEDKRYLLNKDFSFSPNIYLNDTLNSELFFMGYGIEEDVYSDYKDVDISGKTVFFIEGEPEGVELKRKWTKKEKIALAKEKGAKVIIYPNANLEEMFLKYQHYFSKPKMKLYEKDREEEQIVIGITETMAESIFKTEKLKWEKIKKKGLKKYKHFSQKIKLNINRPTSMLSSENVLAYIPGTSKKEELLIITAHYDHIGIDDSLVFNGADDDGTGTVTLIELAEAFSMAVKDGFSPKRSILIMPVSGEEKGLLGSRYYSENPVFPLENTVANLNIDMIGRYDKAHENDSNYIYLIGSDKLSQDLHQLSEKTNELYSNFKLDYTYNEENDPNRFYYRSDHYNFAKNNIPVIFYFSGVHEDYHKATDTVEKIDYQKTEKVARLVFYTAWNIAFGDAEIKLDSPKID